MRLLKLTFLILIIFTANVIVFAAEKNKPVKKNEANQKTIKMPHKRNIFVTPERKKKSDSLVLEAEELIKNSKFLDAQKKLKLALEFNPENEKAQQMLVNVTEVIEQQGIIREIPSKPPKPKKYLGFDLKLNLYFINSESDLQNTYDSNTWTSGVGLDLTYFPISKKLKGLNQVLGFNFNFDYIFLKFKKDAPGYTMMQMGLEAIFRFALSKHKNGLKIGGYLGYRYYNLKNSDNYYFITTATRYGLYNYEKILGPHIGVFAQDALLYYLIQKPAWRKVVFIIKFDWLPNFTEDQPMVFNIKGGVIIQLHQDWNLHIIAWKMYIISKKITEQHLFLSLSGSYRF